MLLVKHCVKKVFLFCQRKEQQEGKIYLDHSWSSLKKKNLPIDKLVSVRTDGALCMIGKNKGFAALFREHENRPILFFHCILHQEALCAQLCGKQFGEVMDMVTSVI